MLIKKKALLFSLILLILILISLNIQAATWQSTAASDYNTGASFDFNWTKVTWDGNIMPVGDDRKHNDLDQAFYDQNLVGYWKFDDVNSTGNGIRDDTNRNNWGLLINGADINAWGMWDSNAGYFAAASNTYVNILSTASLQQDFNSGVLTVSAWIYPLSTATNQGIISRADGGGVTTESFDMITSTNNRLRVVVGDGNNIITAFTANNALVANKWQHIATTLDGSTITIYVDGNVNGTPLEETRKPEINNATLKFGRGYASASYDYSGYIDEIKIYNRALSAAEIYADYNSWMNSNYNSPIKDAGATVQWDNIQWQQLADVNNNVVVDYRSCDDAACDSESWTTGLRACTASACNLSAANNRYFQYRANFDTNKQQWNPIRTGDSDKGIFGHLWNMAVSYTPQGEPPASNFNIDQNKFCFPYAGGTTSSTSFQTRVSVEQGYVGRGTSSTYASELGCIYGFENSPPTVAGIRICDGTCDITKSFSAAQAFTLEVTVTDPNGASDVNTQSFRVTVFTYGDLNSTAEDWDHNSMYLNKADDNLSLGTSDGCVQSGNVYCIKVPNAAWSNKFLWGDVNIYVAVDDNIGAYDMNAVDRNALTLSKIITRSEDTSSGTYSGTSNTTDNAFDNASTPNAYIVTTNNGNVSLSVTGKGSDFNALPYESFNMQYMIGDGNQSWHLSDNAAGSTPFTGGTDTIAPSFHRGIYPDSNTFWLYLWLDMPNLQPAGSYDANLFYDQSEQA